MRKIKLLVNTHLTKKQITIFLSYTENFSLVQLTLIAIRFIM